SSTQGASDTDSLSIPIVQTITMTVDKSSTTSSITAPGNVTYSYLVTNTGNVTLTGIALTDDNATTPVCGSTSLAPSATTTCSAVHTVTQAEIDAGGTLDNTVTASSTQGASDTDTLSIPIVQTPSLSIDKSSIDTTYSAVGTVLDYSFLVTNSGNVTLSGPFTVTDNKAADESCPATASLAPGASITCTATYTVTQADLDAGSVTNVASAHAFFHASPVTSATDTLTINATQTPSLSIDKSSIDTTYSAVGTVLDYSFLVTNSGNVTLSGPFTVTDNKAADESCPATASLAPGASITCTATYTVTQADLDAGAVTNVANAHAFFHASPVTSATDTLTINATQTPSLSIDKSSIDTTYSAVGTVLDYSFLVTNS